jgi:capsular exopolysaccharide synthesis family protein
MIEPQEQAALPGTGAPAGARLREQVAVLWSRRWSVVGVIVAVVGIWAFMAARKAPVYEAHVSVLVKPINLAGKKVDLIMATEQRIAQSLPVATLVAQKIPNADPATVLQGLSVDALPTVPVLDLTYRSSDAKEAARRVQAFAEAYLEHRRTDVIDDLVASSQAIEQQLRVLRDRLRVVSEASVAATSDVERQLLSGQATSLAGQVAVLEQEQAATIPPDNLPVGEILAPALVPTAPGTKLQTLGLALALALGLGVGQAIAREFFAGRIRGGGVAESMLGAPVLATLPALPKPRGGPPQLAEPDTDAAQRFRKLRAAFLMAADQDQVKAVLVTSLGEGSLRPSVTVNLAVALAQAGRRIAVVCADPGEPGLERALGVRATVGDRGLSDVLMGTAKLAEAMKPTTVEGLVVLPFGSAEQDRSLPDLLGSATMESLLVALREHADFVLVDTTPVTTTADTVTLAPFADGLVLVVEADRDTKASLEGARQQFEQAGVHVLGIALIRA